MRFFEQLLFWVHGMSAAAWFGAIFYRTLVIDSKAFAYFPDRKDYPASRVVDRLDEWRLRDSQAPHPTSN